MCRLCVYRKNSGAAIYGQPQAHGVKKYSYSVQPFPSTIQFLVVLRGKRRYVTFKKLFIIKNEIIVTRQFFKFNVQLLKKTMQGFLNLIRNSSRVILPC